MSKRLIGCIEFENEGILITDPCYLNEFKSDGKWSEFLDKFELQWNYSPLYNIEYKLECEKKGIKPEYKIVKPAYQDDHIIVTDTLYGDWSCTVYNCSYEELQNRIANKQRVKKGDFVGQFCADAGLVCICSAKHYSMPENYGDWTYTFIPNFTGIVSLYINDDEEELFIEGEGNISFCSCQTGF